METAPYQPIPTQRRGAKTIIAIVVVAVIALGVWYFVSDPFRTRANEAWKQGTQWTPEQIAKDPVMYLNYVEEQTTKAQQDLKADRIAVEQNKAKLASMKDEAANKVRVGERELMTLVGAYKKSEETNVWPVSYRNRTLDKDGVKTEVVSLDKQVKTQKMLLSKVDAGLTKLDAQVSKIQKAQAEAEAQLADVRANRELLKVQKLTDDLKDRLLKMQGAMAGVIATASESGSTVSLDQLVAESATSADNAAFEKVLTEVKTN